jgi:hypothetical protein
VQFLEGGLNVFGADLLGVGGRRGGQDVVSGAVERARQSVGGLEQRCDGRGLMQELPALGGRRV